MHLVSTIFLCAQLQIASLFFKCLGVQALFLLLEGFCFCGFLISSLSTFQNTRFHQQYITLPSNLWSLRNSYTNLHVLQHKEGIKTHAWNDCVQTLRGNHSNVALYILLIWHITLHTHTLWKDTNGNVSAIPLRHRIFDFGKKTTYNYFSRKKG